MRANALRNWWVVLLLIIVVIGLVIANRAFLTADNVYADRDFMTHWGGGKTVLEGQDPYEPEVWLGLKVEYGSTWMDNDQNPYPLWTAIAFAPLALFSVTDASAIWLALSQVMLVVSLAALLHDYLDRRLSPVELGIIVGGAFISRGVTLTFLTGQLSIFLLFVIVLFLLLFKSDHPFLAGMTLALLALKPNPFFLFVPLIGVWLISHRHWRVIAGGSMGGALLLGISWFVLPGWVSDWVGVRGKLVVTQKTPTVWGLGQELAGAEWWPLAGLILTLLLAIGAGMLILFKRDLMVSDVLVIALIVSLVTTPYMWAYEHALLTIPIVLLYARLQHARKLSMLLYLVLFVILPWLLYIVANNRGLDTLSVFVPVTIGLLYVVSIYRSPRARSEAQQLASPTPV